MKIVKLYNHLIFEMKFKGFILGKCTADNQLIIWSIRIIQLNSKWPSSDGQPLWLVSFWQTVCGLNLREASNIWSRDVHEFLRVPCQLFNKFLKKNGRGWFLANPTYGESSRMNDWWSVGDDSIHNGRTSINGGILLVFRE